MFGTLKPGLCRLKRSQRTAYHETYCGMCKSMGQQYGLASRVMVNHDLVLYALAVEGLASEPAEQTTCRCPVAPWIQRPILAPDTPAMKAIAALQILLADQWLADKEMDNAPLFGRVRPLLKTQHARDLARDMGLDIKHFEGLSLQQARCESRNSSVEEVAEPTARLLGSLFKAIANLKGTDPSKLDSGCVDALYRLGFALGQIVYMMDALVDLSKDRRHNQFNPLLTKDQAYHPSRFEDLFELLDKALSRMGVAMTSIHWLRHHELMNHILLVQLPKRVTQALGKARKQAGLEDMMPAFTPLISLSASGHALHLEAGTTLYGGNTSASSSESKKEKRQRKNNNDDGCCETCTCRLCSSRRCRRICDSCDCCCSPSCDCDCCDCGCDC